MKRITENTCCVEGSDAGVRRRFSRVVSRTGAVSGQEGHPLGSLPHAICIPRLARSDMSVAGTRARDQDENEGKRGLCDLTSASGVNY